MTAAQGFTNLSAWQVMAWGLVFFSALYVAGGLGMTALTGFLQKCGIGRVLDTLSGRPDIDRSTVVVFTSDHGDMCASHSMLDKHYVLYDDIIRIPLVAKIPGAKPRVKIWMALHYHINKT